jgi:hypothetical protein
LEKYLALIKEIGAKEQKDLRKDWNLVGNEKCGFMV